MKQGRSEQRRVPAKPKKAVKSARPVKRGQAPRTQHRAASSSDVSPNGRTARPHSRAEQLLLFAGPQQAAESKDVRPGSRQRQVRSASPERVGAANAGVASSFLAGSQRYVTRPQVNATTACSEIARRFANELQSLVDLPLRLQVHDNRSTMVSFRREPGILHLRVHHMFLRAERPVLQALAEYARSRGQAAGSVLDRFVRSNREHIRPMDVERLRSRPLETRGAVHDLAAIYDALNARYFGGTVDARIGWGRGSTDRHRRSIRMGAYYHDTRTILIHPALDRVEVPRYFVELVVYHEMLHQAVPQHRTASGRRCVHSPEFRARERLFHDYHRARDWEDRNLGLLLRPRSSRSRSGSR